MSRRLAALLVLGILTPLSAHAQLPGGPGKLFEVGIGGGVSVPVSHAEDALKEGFHLRGILKVKPPLFPIGLRGAVGYQKFDLRDMAPGTEGTGSILSGLGGITIGMGMGPVRPYVTASLGAFRIESDIESNGTETSASETKFGIDAGVGLEIRLVGLKGFVEARLENIYTDQGFDSTLLESNSTRIVPVTFGLLF